MTREMAGEELAVRINEAVPSAATSWNSGDVWVETDKLPAVASHLKNAPDLDFALLRSVSAVDYVEYFEVVYHLLSLRRNQSAVIKTRCYSRTEPSVPSLVGIWKGAELQEREVWDLMGVNFEGHPNMKRVLLWEGFPGHPLRKDFLR